MPKRGSATATDESPAAPTAHPRRKKQRAAAVPAAKESDADAAEPGAIEPSTPTAPALAFATQGAGARVRICTSGFTLPQRKYWSLFDTLELNSSFYRTPKPPIWVAWASKLPRESAGYTVKVHQYFTHRKRLRLDDAFRERWTLWYDEHCALLGARARCLLWQLPPNFARSQETEARVRETLLSADGPVGLSSAARVAAGAPPLRCALEFRHASWHAPEIYGALRAAGWCLVTTVQNNAKGWAGDLASGITPPLRPDGLPELTCDWGAYLRFHGAAGKYLGCHGDEEMKAWAGRVGRLLRGSAEREVFVAFNNTDLEQPPSAVVDGLALGRELRALGCME